MVIKIIGFMLGLSISVYSMHSAAELTIEITEGVQSKHNIAVVPFGKNQANDIDINLAGIIEGDLKGSGYFNTLEKSHMLALPTQASAIKFRNWLAIGQDYVVVGNITQKAGRYQVEMSLFDVVKKEQLKGLRVTVDKKGLRKAAHHISNTIYQRLIGVEGVFTTRIAYVTSHIRQDSSRQYNLYVSDYDGANAVSIAESIEPIMSPAWSPDGKQIAYVSFEHEVSEIFVQTLATGARKSVAKYKGINGSPAWSPDGKKLAITLSKDGNSDIYILSLAKLSLRKLTQSWAIDTEATWSPDGKNILFTSDRGRRPQLYIMASNGSGIAERITFEGGYNARGRFSSDGHSIVMVQGQQGAYRIALLDLKTSRTAVLTEGPFDESPSFAPNNRMIIYGRRKGRKEILSTVSIDGLTKQDIQHTQGEVREPAWARQ